MTDIRSDFPRGRSRRLDRFEFRLLVALTFPLFLAATLASRLLGYAQRDEASGPHLSVFAQARANVEATIAFAFMG